MLWRVKTDFRFHYCIDFATKTRCVYYKCVCINKTGINAAHIVLSKHDTCAIRALSGLRSDFVGSKVINLGVVGLKCRRKSAK